MSAVTSAISGRGSMIRSTSNPPRLFRERTRTPASAVDRSAFRSSGGNIVLGLEAGATAMFSSPKPQTAFPTIAFTHGDALNGPIYWVGGRVGFAVNTWMPYFTGGYASTRASFTDFTAAGVNFENGSTGRTDGYYVGGGVDYAVTQNWILGAEYRHYEFNSKLAPAFSSATGLAVPVDDKIIKPKTDTVLFRASYKFGWGGPVVARY